MEHYAHSGTTSFFRDPKTQELHVLLEGGLLATPQRVKLTPKKNSQSAQDVSLAIFRAQLRSLDKGLEFTIDGGAFTVKARFRDDLGRSVANLHESLVLTIKRSGTEDSIDVGAGFLFPARKITLRSRFGVWGPGGDLDPLQEDLWSSAYRQALRYLKDGVLSEYPEYFSETTEKRSTEAKTEHVLARSLRQHMVLQVDNSIDGRKDLRVCSVDCVPGDLPVVITTADGLRRTFGWNQMVHVLAS